jgi:hypothetical protein
VTNEKALNLLYHDYIVRTLQDTITHILGKDAEPISLNLNLENPLRLDSRYAYTDTYPSIAIKTYTMILDRTRPYYAAWHPKDIKYADGFQITGSPTIGASIINPATHTTIHIEVRSQPEHHTIN